MRHFLWSRAMVRTHRRGALVGLVLITLGQFIAQPVPASANASCGHTGTGHYYAASNSGGGTTTATQYHTTTWTSWSVPNNGVNFSNEAVWLGQSGNNANSIEVGFYSGLGNNVAWTNGMLPYYTYSNGNGEYDAAGSPVPSGANLYVYAQTGLNGHHATGKLTQIGGAFAVTLDIGNYVVNTPRQNFMQGEIYNNSSVWMGGGSEQFNMAWQDVANYPNGTWFAWSSMNGLCADNPYTYSQYNSQTWTNGGY
jgi:hypothetical protein